MINPQADNVPFTQITAQQIKSLTDLAQLPQPYPTPILYATFKNTPSDFQVNEILDLELSGIGEHLWLQITKSGMNTTYVAQQLAKWTNILSRDVGYSGLKDRQAVTTQWFSLRIPKQAMPETNFDDFITSNRLKEKSTARTSGGSNEDETIKVLKQVWHSKKLNRGTHKANHFVITLRQIQLNPDVSDNKHTVDTTLNTIGKQGVPNYFGNQRFGRNGNNIVAAIEWFEHGTINDRKPHPKKSRDIQSLLLSSARSAIFNQILAERVINSSWNTGLDGEVFNLEGSGSLFACEQLDEDLKTRVASGDIHPTGPLWGIKNDKVKAEAQAIEAEVIAANPILTRLAKGLDEKQIKSMRRALRLPITNLQWTWPDDSTLVLDFTLPTGTFATSVLASIVKNLDG